MIIQIMRATAKYSRSSTVTNGNNAGAHTSLNQGNYHEERYSTTHNES